MAQQTINLGTVDGDGTGDTLKAGGAKINANFTELYAAIVGLLELKGNIDCSANPNYPAADKGDAYVVNVAGKIGGGSGAPVDIGDLVIAKADNGGGTQASVGTSWFILEHNLAGALLSANNLSDLANAGTARTNLGLVIGTDVAPVASPTFTGTAISVNYQTSTGGQYRFGATRARIVSPSDGQITLQNAAQTDFSLLQLGGVTSSFPAIKRNGAAAQVRLADDSGFAPVQGKLTTDANAAAGTIAPDHTLTLYDAAGTAYKVPCVAA